MNATFHTFIKKVRLDKFTCSPIGSPKGKAEYRRIVDVAAGLSPAHNCYVGTDGINHYFQKHGSPAYLMVPVAADVLADLPFRK